MIISITVKRPYLLEMTILLLAEFSATYIIIYYEDNSVSTLSFPYNNNL